MKKIIKSILKKPINLLLIIIVSCLYFLNNAYFKAHTSGIVQYFMICHFNDFICPLFFLSYSNLLLISVEKEIKKFRWLILFGFCSGLIWEFLAPVFKPTATTDVMDLVFYTLGTTLYYFFSKKFTCRRDIDG